MNRFSREFPSMITSAKQKLAFDGSLGIRTRFGDDGGDSAPAAPVAPSYTSTVQDYINNYPAIYGLMQQYGPQEAALQKSINEQLYPETAGLQEQLAGVAARGMGADAPDWYKQQTNDYIKSQYGRNAVFNPLGQQASASQYQSSMQDWTRYYQNLGLSVAGRQPLATYNNNITSQYTPSQSTGYASNTYGTQANIYGTQSSNWQNSQQNPWMNIVGSLAGGVGSGVGSGVGMYSMSKFLGK